MSRQQFSIAYSGRDRKDDHSIDVETLAPSLLAFGKMLREANVVANGKKSKAKILVTSDFEHRCFQVNFELLVSLYEQAKMLLGSEPVQTAKEVLEWVGLLKPAGVAGATTLTYLGYLKYKKGRKAISAQQIRDQDGSGSVLVTLEGDGNTINVTNNVFNLSNNQKALKATRDAFAPIGQDNFDAVQLKSNGDVLGEITYEEVKDIVASCNTTIEQLTETEPDIDEMTAWLSPYSPVFDAKAQNWQFNYGREHVYVDISETSIASDALARGSSSSEDSYQVRLEVTTPIDRNGATGKPSYKILEVLNFIPSSQPAVQTDIESFLRDPD